MSVSKNSLLLPPRGFLKSIRGGVDENVWREHSQRGVSWCALLQMTLAIRYVKSLYTLTSFDEGAIYLVIFHLRNQS